VASASSAATSSACSKREEDKNQCSNNEVTAYLKIEELVLTSMIEDLGSPSIIKRLEEQLNGRLAHKIAAYESKRRRLEQQLRETDEAIRKVLHAIEKMDCSDALAERLAEHETRRATIKRELQTLEVPQLIDLSRLTVPCDMSAIHQMRQTEQGRAAWRDILERLVTHVEVAPPSWNLAVDGLENAGPGEGQKQRSGIPVDPDEAFRPQDAREPRHLLLALGCGRLEVSGACETGAQLGRVFAQIAALHLGADPEPVVEVGSSVAMAFLDAPDDVGGGLVEVQSQEFLIGHLCNAGM